MGSCNLSPFVENEGVSLVLVSRVSPLSSEGCSAAMPVKKKSREEKILFAKGLLGELPLGLLIASLKWKWPAA